jgi:hypothetical protein
MQSQRAPQIEIEAALVAPSFGLHPQEFQKLLQSGKIASLCERGTGEDSGTYRISFYHQRQRARLVIAADGTVLSREVSSRTGKPDRPRPA